MIRVTGEVQTTIHFEVEVDAESIDALYMPLHESDSLIAEAIEKKYGHVITKTDFIKVIEMNGGKERVNE